MPCCFLQRMLLLILFTILPAAVIGCVPVKTPEKGISAGNHIFCFFFFFFWWRELREALKRAGLRSRCDDPNRIFIESQVFGCFKMGAALRGCSERETAGKSQKCRSPESLWFGAAFLSYAKSNQICSAFSLTASYEEGGGVEGRAFGDDPTLPFAGCQKYESAVVECNRIRIAEGVPPPGP